MRSSHRAGAPNGAEEKVGERKRIGQIKGPTVVVRAWSLFEESIAISTGLSKVRLKLFLLKIFYYWSIVALRMLCYFLLNSKVYLLYEYIHPLLLEQI